MRRKGRGKSRPDFFVCPHCGADVPAGATACRECGSDDETGWSEGADAWDAGIPAGYGHDEDFEYDEYVEDHFPGHAPPLTGRAVKRWSWGLLVLLVCLALLRFLVVP